MKRKAHRAVASRRPGFEILESRKMLHAGYTAVAEGEDAALPQEAFSLEDVNVNSTTYAQAVSPRDYLDQVSGWYFGHAT